MDAAPESAVLERAAHLKLPAGATGLRYHQERGADPAIWLRLQIPAAARAAFLRDAGYPDALSSERRYVRNDQLPGESWWRPDEVAAFESGHLLRDQGRPRYGSNLLMSRGEGAITVYLFVTGL